MGSHKMDDRHLTVVSVKKSGYSGELAKGQFGIFDVQTVSSKGLKALDNFSNLSRNAKFEMRLGKADVAVTRSQSNKSWSSIPFKLEDVKKISVSAPTVTETIFDELTIGYNGIDPETSMSFKAGDNVVIDLELSGEAMGLLGYKDNMVNVKVYIDVPECDYENTCEDCDPCATQCKEVVDLAVKRLKEKVLLGNVPITDYIDITPVLSCDPAGEAPQLVPYDFNCLSVCDEGDSNALAKVAGQYPEFKVERTSREGSISKYEILAEQGTTLADFETSLPTLIKGCLECPTGYTEVEGGFVYSVTLEDDGVDSEAIVEGLANAVAGSAVKQGQNDGVGTYTVVLTQKLSEEDRQAFIDSSDLASTSRVTGLGEVKSVCENDTITTIAWEVCGTCNAATKKFRITLPDTECKETRLPELQANYEDLNIVELSDPAPAGCQRVYETKVITNLVCDECDPIFNDVFTAEAPADFDITSWKPVAEEVVDGQACLCGIRVKGKEIRMITEECLRDDLPFIDTSTRIKIAGGYPTEVNESVKNFDNRFAVTILSRAQDKDNLSGYFQGFEDMSKTYFDGTPRHYNDNYAKFLLGEESNLNQTGQIIDYAVTIDKSKYGQSFSGRVIEAITYHILVKVGEQQEIEAILNSLAGAAGIDPVQALAG